MREALYWEPRGEGVVKCLLCPQGCVIRPGDVGLCRGRKNVAGKLHTTNYARCTSYGVDPIEKKPLYHFYPGADILSLGTFGCNLSCGFCQNWQISQREASSVHISPERAVELAVEENRRTGTCIGVSYTYSEPLIWYEYVLDTARLAKEKGLQNVLVTNGYVNREPLERLVGFVDAMNIDVKSFTDEFYRRMCKGRLDPVLRTVELAKEHCHIELTCLLIPTLNDSREEIGRLVEWVASLDREIPLHFSRYFPQYRLELPPTPIETLRLAREIAREKLSFVYLGNVWGGEGSDTHCPNCGALLVARRGFSARIAGLKGRKCGRCGRDVRLVV